MLPGAIYSAAKRGNIDVILWLLNKRTFKIDRVADNLYGNAIRRKDSHMMSEITYNFNINPEYKTAIESFYTLSKIEHLKFLYFILTRYNIIYDMSKFKSPPNFALIVNLAIEHKYLNIFDWLCSDLGPPQYLYINYIREALDANKKELENVTNTGEIRKIEQTISTITYILTLCAGL